MASKRYQWAAPGDVNAFFGLMLDNIADLLLTVTLLHTVFAFPTKFALRYMVPGTAIGVLVGDLLFFWMAFALARRTGRRTVTAMPLGLDTPSTFGMVFFVLGPSYLAAKAALGSEEAAARLTWHIGICSIVISGVFKLICAGFSHWIRRLVPRAGLLGSLAAIALVLISFLPLLEVLQHPVVGFTALAIILTTLLARIPLPFKIPGALGALLVGGVIYYAMKSLGLLQHVSEPEIRAGEAFLPYEWLTVFRFEWLNAIPQTLPFLPIVIPFALATVVGGIDCTESAAAAGDDFDTRQVIAVEAVATLAAGVCGGVIQTTPYIGHPAYKAMGGRAAYTLATALFVAAAGLIGFFGWMYVLIPKPTVFPILIFIGLEITAQSFLATPRRHYTAVALACIPALAFLGLNFPNRVLGDLAVHLPNAQQLLSPELSNQLQTLRVLSNGFIVTSLLWASGMTALIDRRMVTAAACFMICAACTLFGVIHSPFADGQVFQPWQLSGNELQVVIRYASGYAMVALMLIAWSFWLRWSPTPQTTLDLDDDMLGHPEEH